MADYNDDNDGSAVGVVDGDKKDEEILKSSREGLQKCIEDEHDERQKMLDDIHFVSLDQWPADVRRAREGDVLNGHRPCLTIDQINQYTTQVSNDMRVNRPSIKIRPVDDKADPKTAQIFQGIIRHIEDQSNAAIAYQTAGESAVDIGLGFFRVVTDYIPDTHDQEILIRRVPDTFSVYLSAHQMPDGSDAEKGWILENVPVEQFKSQFPKAKIDDSDFSGLGIKPTWKTEQFVVVCEYFYKEYSKEKLLLLENDQSVYESDYEKLPEPRPEIVSDRMADRVRVKWCKHTGCEVLDKKDWAGKYIPIIEEVGKEKIVDGKRILWGLVRPAKDSLRAFNYWISAMTEKMALAPKSPFIGAVGQFASQGDKWDKANINNYSKLEYDPIDVNGNAVPPPQRQQPMQMEPAMAQMLSIMQNNVKSSLGMYKAAIGDTESQQSGRAILALKKESDTGTLHFGENQAISITHCGRIIVDLIPKIMDTRRIQRILGEDGKPSTVRIDPEQQESVREFRDSEGNISRIYNLGVGKYDVTATVGPGYTTSRQEAATVMTELANSAKDPVSAAIMRYGAVKNSDFHGSEEIMRMLKATLPPALQQTEDGDEPMPQKAIAAMQQMQQELQQIGEAAQKMAQENQQLKSGAQADMAKLQAEAEKSRAELQLKAQIQAEELRLEREKAEAELQLEREKVQAQIQLEREKAEAKLNLDVMTMQANQRQQAEKMAFDHECRMRDDQEKRASKTDD